MIDKKLLSEKEQEENIKFLVLYFKRERRKLLRKGIEKRLAELEYKGDSFEEKDKLEWLLWLMKAPLHYTPEREILEKLFNEELI